MSGIAGTCDTSAVMVTWWWSQWKCDGRTVKAMPEIRYAEILSSEIELHLFDAPSWCMRVVVVVVVGGCRGWW